MGKVGECILCIKMIHEEQLSLIFPCLMGCTYPMETEPVQTYELVCEDHVTRPGEAKVPKEFLTTWLGKGPLAWEGSLGFEISCISGEP